MPVVVNEMSELVEIAELSHNVHSTLQLNSKMEQYCTYPPLYHT